jgi:hypothetical protein
MLALMPPSAIQTAINRTSATSRTAFLDSMQSGTPMERIQTFDNCVKCHRSTRGEHGEGGKRGRGWSLSSEMLFKASYHEWWNRCRSNSNERTP